MWINSRMIRVVLYYIFLDTSASVSGGYAVGK